MRILLLCLTVLASFSSYAGISTTGLQVNTDGDIESIRMMTVTGKKLSVEGFNKKQEFSDFTISTEDAKDMGYTLSELSRLVMDYATNDEYDILIFKTGNKIKLTIINSSNL